MINQSVSLWIWSFHWRLKLSFRCLYSEVIIFILIRYVFKHCLLILPLFIAICEIWLLELTYDVYLILFIKPSATTPSFWIISKQERIKQGTEAEIVKSTSRIILRKWSCIFRSMNHASYPIVPLILCASRDREDAILYVSKNHKGCIPAILTSAQLSYFSEGLVTSIRFLLWDPNKRRQPHLFSKE